MKIALLDKLPMPLEELLRTLPRKLVRVGGSQDSSQVRLTIYGLAICEEHREVVDAFVALHRLGAKRFIEDPHGSPNVGKQDLRGLLPNMAVAEFEAIAEVINEDFAGGSTSWPNGAWARSIDPYFVAYEKVETFSDWLRIRDWERRVPAILEQVHLGLLREAYEYRRKQCRFPDYSEFLVAHRDLGNIYEILNEIPQSYLWELVTTSAPPRQRLAIKLSFHGIAASGAAYDDLALFVKCIQMAYAAYESSPDSAVLISSHLAESLDCSEDVIDRVGYLLNGANLGVSVHNLDVRPWSAKVSSQIIDYRKVTSVDEFFQKKLGYAHGSWEKEIVKIPPSWRMPFGRIIDAPLPEPPPIAKPPPKEKASNEKKAWGKWEKVEEYQDAGKQGKVYLVRHSVDGRKGILKELSLGKEQRRKRILREVQNQKKLNHPGIARVLDDNWNAVEKGRSDKAWLVTEFAERGSLKALAATFGNQLELSLTAFLHVCDGIIHAHEKGVVHRDLHPGNIVFGSNLQTPKVIDFGLCVTQEDLDGERTTQADETLGDPDFAPPEYRKGRTRELNEQGDVFSLGKVLYFMLSGGEKAIHENFNDPSLDKKWNDSRYRILYERLFPKTCAYDPKERYSSVKELKAEVKKVLDGLRGADGHGIP